MRRNPRASQRKLRRALARAQRRRQLWHAARLAAPDDASFLARLHDIESAVAAQLAREFPSLR